MSQRREREKDTFSCEGYPAVSAAIRISALPGSTQAAQLYSQTEQLLAGSGGGSSGTDLGVTYSSTLMQVKETDGV